MFSVGLHKLKKRFKRKQKIQELTACSKFVPEVLIFTSANIFSVDFDSYVLLTVSPDFVLDFFFESKS